MNLRNRLSAVVAVVLLSSISEIFAGQYDYPQSPSYPKQMNNPTTNAGAYAASPSVSPTVAELSNDTLSSSVAPIITDAPSIDSSSASTILSSEATVSPGSPSISDAPLPTELISTLSTDLLSTSSDLPLETMETELPIIESTTLTQKLESTSMSGDMKTEGPIEAITSGHGREHKRKRTRKPYTAAPTYPPVDFDCKGKIDGYYADPKDKCSWKYYACVGNIAYRMDCSSKDLVYEPDSGICERRHDSFRCTGNRKTTPKPTPRPPQPTASDLKLPVNCEKVGDGWHADPEKKCSHDFYSCSNGIGAKFTCPGNMYYDKESGACESFQDVVDCSGKKPATTMKPTVATTPKEKVPIDCLNLPSGPHPDPSKKCSSFYYVCSNGDGWKRECPPGLLYDEKNKWCNYRDEIPACGGGQKKSTVAPTKAPQPSQSSLISKEFDCSGKEDGSYLPKDKKCSADYFRCVAGSAYKVSCPKGLYYDVEKDLCERHDDLFACSGKKPTSPKPSVATLQPKPTEKLPIDCGKNKDGDYPDPEKKCSSVYYTCSGQIGVRRKCPPALYFDKDLKICEAKEHVGECGGKLRPTLASIKPVPVTKSPYNCDQKNDGNYEAGKCVGHYFACIGGSATKVHCPKGLMYDSEMDECGYKDEIPACGGSRPSPAVDSKPEPETKGTTKLPEKKEYK